MEKKACNQLICLFVGHGDLMSHHTNRWVGVLLAVPTHQQLCSHPQRFTGSPRVSLVSCHPYRGWVESAHVSPVRHRPQMFPFLRCIAIVGIAHLRSYGNCVESQSLSKLSPKATTHHFTLPLTYWGTHFPHADPIL